MSERIVPRLTDQIQGVGETIVQVAFDRHGLVERSENIFRNLFGKLRNARIKRRKLQIRCGDIRRIVGQSRAQLGCIEGRQAGNTGIPYGTVIVERIQKRAGGIPKDRSAAHRGKRVSAFAGKISAKTSDSSGDENSIGGKRFEVYGVEHARIMRIGLGCRIRGVNPAILFGLQLFRLVIRRSPPPPVKGRECNAPPAQPVISEGLKLARPRYPALKRGKKKNSTPPRAMDPTATLRAERLSARFNLRSRSVCRWRAGETAPTAPRRNSIPTKVEIPNRRKTKKRIRKIVSTVRTAAARIAAKDSMERNSASRSVTAL